MVSAVPRPQVMARMLTPMLEGDQPSTRMAKTAEAEAPEVMPMMSGLASWFLVGAAATGVVVLALRDLL